MKYLTACLIIIAGLFAFNFFSYGEDTKPVLKIYGTEGPAPCIQEAADAFAAANGVKIEVTNGPVEKWRKQAAKDADIIYSSSENVMDFYNDDLGIIDDKTISSLFMRPAALLVRKGNPQKIKGIKDLLSRDLTIIIVNGQGQVALWEDIVGRLKDIKFMAEFRKHVVFNGRNTSEAIQYWKNHPEVDAWLTYNTWAKREDMITADLVNIEKDLVVYRSMGAAVTTITNQRDLALKFIESLKTADAEKVFKAKGWFKKEK
jgi:accessory colonization factor AcfC